MSYYTPDRWMIARITSHNHPPIDKIIGSWYGGYAGSDKWRFSSGITKVVEHDDHYEVHNYSGSVYTLFKGSEGASAYTAATFNNMATQLEDSGEGMMRIINIKECTATHVKLL